MEIQISVTQILLIFAALSVLTNIIVEVTKSFVTFGSAGALNLYVTVVAVVLSVIAFSAYWTISDLIFRWYLVPAFVVGGVLAAYAAMFGYDKLSDQIASIFSKDT